eukprot:scaffold442244_cov45-Prasinocladus_malaysianus.AAC.1
MWAEGAHVSLTKSPSEISLRLVARCCCYRQQEATRIRRPTSAGDFPCRRFSGRRGISAAQDC